jgi:hypothetical protein
MKKILPFVVLISSIISAQNIYFSKPLSGHTYPIGPSGQGPIEYNMYCANGWVVYHYYARLRYPDGSWTNWMEGEIGGWWVTKAGTYQIEGKAYAAWCMTPSYIQVLHRDPFSFYLVDNYAPAIPQNFQVSFQRNQNPVLSWNANSEADLSGYRVYKKYTLDGGEGGSHTWSEFTTSTSLTDDDFTADYKFGEDEAEYWIVAEDINNNSSGETQHISGDGTSHIQWKLSANSNEKPSDYNLSQNYPNPFNPSTRISWQSPEAGQQSLKIYDLLGNEVVTLVNEWRDAGKYSVEFNAKNLPSGVYIYQLNVNGYISSKKLTLLK